jgi:riboflavin transporter FmnP
MNPLKIILTIKVIFTIFWALPLLFFPKHAARLLGIPVPQPILFAHLLGAAFLALLAGYILGLLELKHGKDISNTVWVGIISNGLAFLILLIFAGQWKRWGTGAEIYMWSSTTMTLLITLGLIVFGVVYN